MLRNCFFCVSFHTVKLNSCWKMVNLAFSHFAFDGYIEHRKRVMPIKYILFIGFGIFLTNCSNNNIGNGHSDIKREIKWISIVFSGLKIFLCLSAKFPHQDTRWNFGISCSASLHHRFYWQVPEEYLEPSWTSTMDLCCENSGRLLTVNYFCKKASSQMFSWVLNTLLSLSHTLQKHWIF